MQTFQSNRSANATTTLLAILLLLAGSRAWSQFPIEITSELNEMDIALSPISVANQAIVKVENKEDFEIQCTGWFRNGPEREERRIMTVGPQQNRQLAVRLTRRPVVVRVRVECNKSETPEQ